MGARIPSVAPMPLRHAAPGIDPVHAPAHRAWAMRAPAAR